MIPGRREKMYRETLIDGFAMIAYSIGISLSTISLVYLLRIIEACVSVVPSPWIARWTLYPLSFVGLAISMTIAATLSGIVRDMMKK